MQLQLAADSNFEHHVEYLGGAFATVIIHRPLPSLDASSSYVFSVVCLRPPPDLLPLPQRVSFSSSAATQTKNGFTHPDVPRECASSCNTPSAFTITISRGRRYPMTSKYLLSDSVLCRFICFRCCWLLFPFCFHGGRSWCLRCLRFSR